MFITEVSVILHEYGLRARSRKPGINNLTRPTHPILDDEW